MRHWPGVSCMMLAVACGSGDLEHRCAGVLCGSAPPPLELIIATTSPPGGPAADATLANVERPRGAGAVPNFSCATGPGTPASPATRKCYIYGSVAGAYQADVIAAGFQTKHVHVDVPPWGAKPGECCTPEYVPTAVSVYLSPSD